MAVNDRSGHGGPVADAIRTAFPADVTDPSDTEALVAAVARDLGPIDVLVLNATGPQPEGLVDDVDRADHLAQLGRAVLPSMRARGYGRIVHVDSEVVDRPPPGSTA